MIAEDVEFQISQYADGTLSAAERASVDDLLKADPAARQMLAEYRRLDGHLARLGGSPALRWDRLAEHLSGAVLGSDEPAVAGRIEWATSWRGRMRIAAAVLLAVTAGIIVNRSLRHPTVGPIATPAAVTDVTGPAAEVATGKPAEDVSVCPSRLASGEGESPYAISGVVHGPSKVVISEAISNPKPAGKSRMH
jgi:anti-sigma factor RsiW